MTLRDGNLRIEFEIGTVFFRQNILGYLARANTMKSVTAMMILGMGLV